MEVLYAHQRGIPVVVIDAQPKEERKALSPWLVFHTNAVVSSLGEAIDAVEDLCLCEPQLDAATVTVSFRIVVAS